MTVGFNPLVTIVDYVEHAFKSQVSLAQVKEKHDFTKPLRKKRPWRNSLGKFKKPQGTESNDLFGLIVQNNNQLGQVRARRGENLMEISLKSIRMLRRGPATSLFPHLVKKMRKNPFGSLRPSRYFFKDYPMKK